MLSGEYVTLLSDIKKRIISARIKAARSVNKALIRLYWDICKTITDKQAEKGWGQHVIEQLASDLANDFEGQNSFSANNLWRM
ncbi:MAG TPA: DUF1016 N-terminal domain-containing protein, partial [Smithellaceae bacterium]|nr:DUF1016 N-terminal domain-containing protein [Smithellaceae bacterium]